MAIKTNEVKGLLAALGWFGSISGVVLSLPPWIHGGQAWLLVTQYLTFLFHKASDSRIRLVYLTPNLAKTSLPFTDPFANPKTPIKNPRVGSRT